MKKIILLGLVMQLLVSCAGQKLKTDLKAKQDLKAVWNNQFIEDFNDTKALDVLVVTNRKPKDQTFGCLENSFDITNDKTLHFGTCKVNIPKNHSTGEISIATEPSQSSHDYFKILDSKELKEAEILDELKKAKNTPLVFVHGFNVKYQEAVLRAAQIAYDLKYQGPVVVFTWPAGASDGFFEEKFLNKTYAKNRNNARESTIQFRDFLLSLQRQDIKINLVVHSMGHQMVLPVLNFLASKKNEKTLISELVLNAPDFDSAQFKKMAENIKNISDHVTLYCSYNDKAMIASGIMNSSERLGACAFMKDLDVINVSAIDDSALGLGHGYYSSRDVLTDVFQALLGIDAEKRLFMRKAEPNSAEKYFLRK